MDFPLLSVCLITYNHKNYIRQAIEGILMQKVNFTWELIIADDCSTDGTREIILEYKEKYPKFIRLILQSNNVGPARNWLDLITTPKSKYIAYFEGDDYWTDPNKLQIQIDYLEKYPQFAMCFHDFVVENEMTCSRYPGKMEKRNRTAYEVVRSVSLHTSTVLFRKCFDQMPIEILKVKNGDTFLFALIASVTDGDAAYLGNILPSVYRVHAGGVWTSKTSRERAMQNFDTFTELKKIVRKRYLPFINCKLSSIAWHTTRNGFSSFSFLGVLSGLTMILKVVLTNSLTFHKPKGY